MSSSARKFSQVVSQTPEEVYSYSSGSNYSASEDVTYSSGSSPVKPVPERDNISLGNTAEFDSNTTNEGSAETEEIEAEPSQEYSTEYYDESYYTVKTQSQGTLTDPSPSNNESFKVVQLNSDPSDPHNCGVIGYVYTYTIRKRLRTIRKAPCPSSMYKVVYVKDTPDKSADAERRIKEAEDAIAFADRQMTRFQHDKELAEKRKREAEEERFRLEQQKYDDKGVKKCTSGSSSSSSKNREDSSADTYEKVPLSDDEYDEDEDEDDVEGTPSDSQYGHNNDGKSDSAKSQGKSGSGDFSTNNNSTAKSSTEGSSSTGSYSATGKSSAKIGKAHDKKGKLKNRLGQSSQSHASKSSGGAKNRNNFLDDQKTGDKESADGLTASAYSSYTSYSSESGGKKLPPKPDQDRQPRQRSKREGRGTAHDSREQKGPQRQETDSSKDVRKRDSLKRKEHSAGQREGRPSIRKGRDKEEENHSRVKHSEEIRKAEGQKHKRSSKDTRISHPNTDHGKVHDPQHSDSKANKDQGSHRGGNVHSRGKDDEKHHDSKSHDRNETKKMEEVSHRHHDKDSEDQSSRSSRAHIGKRLSVSHEHHGVTDSIRRPSHVQVHGNVSKASHEQPSQPPSLSQHEPAKTSKERPAQPLKNQTARSSREHESRPSQTQHQLDTLQGSQQRSTQAENPPDISTKHQTRTSQVQPRISQFQPQISQFQPQVSQIQSRISQFQPQTSQDQPRISQFQPRTSQHHRPSQMLPALPPPEHPEVRHTPDPYILQLHLDSLKRYSQARASTQSHPQPQQATAQVHPNNDFPLRSHQDHGQEHPNFLHSNEQPHQNLQDPSGGTNQQHNISQPPTTALEADAQNQNLEAQQPAGDPQHPPSFRNAPYILNTSAPDGQQPNSNAQQGYPPQPPNPQDIPQSGLGPDQLQNPPEPQQVQL